MKILVTGGMGYIGSNTVVELINRGYEPVILDNLSNSSKNVLDSIYKITNKKVTFYEEDCTNEKRLDEIFKKEQFEGLIHFAGYKAVGESVEKPLDYYYNNVLSTIILSKLSKKYNLKHFIFSSSATVYGDQPSPLKESMPLGETTNPYGESKKISERVLMDFSKTYNDINIVLLRYFNPIGAHSSGLIGEVPKGVPNNLMPCITQVASNKREKLFVFGDDYETKDGTGVRDYIHVVDLAIGHIKALEHDKKGISIYNLGTGEGISVLELVNTFMKENNINIPYEIVERRKGDLATVYADTKKAKKELDFETKLGVKEMVKSSWNFEKNIK